MKSRLGPNPATKLTPKIPPMVHRWLVGYCPNLVSTNAAPSGSGNRVFLTGFEVENDVTVDAININNGDSVAGNVIVGIYGPIPTAETCLGASLAGQSASTALSGINAPQIIPLTAAVRLNAGRYYAAVEWSDTTARYFRQTNQTLVLGAQGQTYDIAAGFGALTDPCPAVTNTASILPVPKIRCVV